MFLLPRESPPQSRLSLNRSLRDLNLSSQDLNLSNQSSRDHKLSSLDQHQSSLDLKLSSLDQFQSRLDLNKSSQDPRQSRLGHRLPQSDPSPLLSSSLVSSQSHSQLEDRGQLPSQPSLGEHPEPDPSRDHSWEFLLSSRASSLSLPSLTAGSSRDLRVSLS